MRRRYELLIQHHFKENNEMLFLAGPRQVGKTFTSNNTPFTDSALQHIYINWDNVDDREIILAGPKAVCEKIGLHKTVIFDEIHKYKKWKDFLKGFFDTYASNGRLHIIVTGSARLDVFQKSGDSLLGRYFLYRMHPISVGECCNYSLPKNELSQPSQIENDLYDNLLRYSGFPKPFLNGTTRFYNKWSKSRFDLLLGEDIRDISRIHEIAQVKLLGELISKQSGQLSTYSSFAKKIRVSEDTVKRWIETLEMLYYCFLIRPWSKNISRSLLKEPKIYLWDWSAIKNDVGARNENMIASHLLKSIHWWNDNGFGEYGLHFIRTKDKKEVDFLITKENSPWCLLEVKTSMNTGLSKSLIHFHKILKTEHAFQVVMDADYIERDCFSLRHPVKVPAKTLLSQLI